MADLNALNLADYAVMSNDPLVMMITESLLVNGAVFTDIPFVNKKSLVANGVRWEDNLPTVNWAKLNSALTVTKGKPKPYQEQVYLMRNAIDVDIKLLEDVNRITDPRVAQLKAYLRSVTYDYNDKFINNNHTSGEDDAPVGLKERLDNYSLYGLNSEMKVNFGAVDLTTAMTATTANTYIEKLTELLSYMGADEGDGVVIYMNDLLIRRTERAIRVMGAGAGFDTTRDAFGRSVNLYRNAKIVNIGRKADQSTRIILNTETSTGAAGADNHTSLYAVKYGEDGMLGWQFESLGESIKDVGLIGNDGVITRLVIDWASGLFPTHTRCIARGYGIKVS